MVILKVLKLQQDHLGQGICNAVGMAIAEAHLAEKFNKPDYKVVDHYTYAICW